MTLLLQLGANPDSCDATGDPVLHTALRLRDEFMIQELLSSGASPIISDAEGRHAIEIARQCGVTAQVLKYFEYFESLKYGGGKTSEDSKGGEDRDLSIGDEISLRSYSLRVVPKYIWSLTYIVTLDLSGNMLPELSTEVTSLVNLKSLDVSNNKISLLPPELSSLSSLTSLNLEGNPLNYFPPADLVPRSTQKILEVLKKYNEQEILWRRVTVRVMGRSGVGKTSLLSKLTGRKGKSTAGQRSSSNYLEIYQWDPNMDRPNLDSPQKEYPVFHFWNLNVPSEVMYNFAKIVARSIYMIVFDIRDANFDIEIADQIHAIRGRYPKEFHPPIILVGTFADRSSPQQMEIAQNFAASKYPREPLLLISSQNSSHISDLRSTLLSSTNLSLRVKVSGSFLYLASRVFYFRDTGSPVIQMSTFCDVAKKCGMKEEDINEAVTHFDHLGVTISLSDIIQRRENQFLITDPIWLLELFATVQFDGKGNGNPALREPIVMESQIRTLWEFYGDEIRPFILDILEGMELLFSFHNPRHARLLSRNKQNRRPSHPRSDKEEREREKEGGEREEEKLILIPSLLPSAATSACDTWHRTQGESAATVRLFRFSYFPPEVTLRFLASCLALYPLSAPWKKGILIQTGDPSLPKVAYLEIVSESYTLLMAVRTRALQKRPHLLCDLACLLERVVDEYCPRYAEGCAQFIPCRHCLGNQVIRSGEEATGEGGREGGGRGKEISGGKESWKRDDDVAYSSTEIDLILPLIRSRSFVTMCVASKFGNDSSPSSSPHTSSSASPKLCPSPKFRHSSPNVPSPSLPLPSSSSSSLSLPPPLLSQTHSFASVHFFPLDYLLKKAGENCLGSVTCPFGNVRLPIAFLSPDISFSGIRHIKNLVLKEKIGEGGQAVVYRAIIFPNKEDENDWRELEEIKLNMKRRERKREKLTKNEVCKFGEGEGEEREGGRGQWVRSVGTSAKDRALGKRSLGCGVRRKGSCHFQIWMLHTSSRTILIVSAEESSRSLSKSMPHHHLFSRILSPR